MVHIKLNVPSFIMLDPKNELQRIHNLYFSFTSTLLRSLFKILEHNITGERPKTSLHCF